MPDLPIEPPFPGRYPSGVESRLAVLKQIARETIATLSRIERRQDMLAAEQRAEFRPPLGIMPGGFSALLGVTAHGFHWL